MKRIEILRLDKNLKASDICSHLGLSSSTYTTWRTKDRTPDATFIPRIAEMFGVSCNYILTGEEPDLSKNERLLISTYNSMNEEGQRLLLEYAEFLKDRYIKNDTTGVVSA